MVETVLQQMLVILGLTGLLQVAEKAPHRHVGNCQQIREFNIESLPEFAAVSILQSCLGWGEKSPARMIDRVPIQRA